MPYQEHTWTVIAQDYNSQLTRNYIFARGFSKYPETIGIPRLRIATISKKNAITYCADLSRWKECHEALKKKVEEKYSFVNDLIDKTNELGEKTNTWTQKHILDADLTKLSPTEIIAILKKVVDKVGDLYLYGVTLPILDFGGFSFIEGNLQKYLKEKCREGEYAEYYRVFTEPIHNSFGQDQEEDILQLMQEFYEVPSWKTDVQTKSLKEIEEKCPVFYKKLQEHTRKYCWVYYVFSGPAFTEQNFLDFIKDYFYKRIEPQKKLAELTTKKKEIQEKRAAYLKKLQPDPFHRAILEVAGKLVWAKPRRKDYQSRSYYHLEFLQREIGKRLELSLQEVRCMPLEMIEEYLIHKKPVDKKMLSQLYELHVCVPEDDGTVTILYGKEAEEFAKKIVSEQVKTEQTQEVKGMCACMGIAKGTAKLINHPADMHKMEYGNILISVATSPAIVPAMKKAAAIISDEGGLTCHASIVSRELNIPCVVGTKIGTKIFKDGDIIEVDATKGIVRRINERG